MSILNGAIISPVSVDDVRTVLGVSTTDVGRLCRSEKINMWCRNKPVHYPSISETDRNVLGYGIEAYADSGDTPEMVALSDAGAYAWSYQRPGGGAQSPYRLTDFWGYQNNCYCPLRFNAFDVAYGDYSTSLLLECDDDIGIDSDVNVTFGELFKVSKYGTYRLSLAVVDTSGTYPKVMCWFLGTRIDGADATLNRPNYKELVVNTGISAFGLENGKTYTGVVMLTNYGEWLEDFEDGISATQMNGSGAKAISLEPEEGVSRFEFTYYSSLISETMNARLTYSGCYFEKRQKYGTKTTDIYNWNTFEGEVDWSTAKLIRNSCEIQIELQISGTSGHYAFDYLGKGDNEPDTSQWAQGATYILDRWRDGKEYITTEPGWTDAERNAKYGITLTDFLGGYKINVTNSGGLEVQLSTTAPIFFDATGDPAIGESVAVYTATIRANIRRTDNSSSVRTLMSDTMQVVAGNDYWYSYDE